MTAFDTLQRASFNDIEFPVEDIDVAGEIRDHVHEFPHTDGGQPEKLGRKLYVVTMQCPFYQTFPKYPGLWPEKLDSIKDLFEAQTTAPLHVPTIGTISAYIRTFRRRASNKNLAGEDVSITFVEDSTLDFIVTNLVKAGSDGLQDEQEALNAAFALFEQDVAANGALADASQSVNSAVNAFLAVRDSVDVFVSKLESSILRVAQTCDSMDRALKLNDVGSAPVILALHALWGTAIQIQKDLQNNHTDLQVYIVPATMSISQVSTTLYGDTSHAIELLNLNNIQDSRSILPNTPIRYYPAI